MLWILRKAVVGGQPSTIGGNTVIQVTLQDIEGPGLEVHNLETLTSSLKDPNTVWRSVCTAFNANHVPNNFDCADLPVTREGGNVPKRNDTLPPSESAKKDAT